MVSDINIVAMFFAELVSGLIFMVLCEVSDPKTLGRIRLCDGFLHAYVRYPTQTPLAGYRVLMDVDMLI